MHRIECKHPQRPDGVVSISTLPLKNLQEDIYGCVIVLKDETRLASLESDLASSENNLTNCASSATDG